MRSRAAALWLCAGWGAASGCSHAQPPAWLYETAVQSGRVCSWGIAGRAYDPKSDEPRVLATTRAIQTLAGAYLTAVIQSEVSRSNERRDFAGQTELVVQVPDDVVHATADAIEDPDLWRDPEGVGPLGPEGRGFTFARVCVRDEAIEASRRDEALRIAPFAEQPPAWLDWVGRGDEVSLCALGYSAPVYDPATVFKNVEEEVRAQLLERAQTWVLESVHAQTQCRQAQECQERVDAELAITTEAISRGVVLTHFWYDWKGARRQRGAWGWGCVYRGVVADNALDQVRQRLARR